MTLQDLGSIGELIAALATLLTLAYLATQVRQAREQFQLGKIQARTQYSAETANRAADIQLGWFADGRQSQAMMKALLTEENLTQEERFEFNTNITIFFGSLVQTEMLNRRGLLDLETRELRRAIYMPYLQMPRVRRWWQRWGRKFYGFDETADMIDAWIAEDDAEWQGISAATELDLTNEEGAKPV